MTQATRIKDMPDLERPRERLAAQGAEALSPTELIAILLRTGLRGRSAIEVAHELIRQQRLHGTVAVRLGFTEVVNVLFCFSHKISFEVRRKTGARKIGRSLAAVNVQFAKNR